MTRSDTHDYLQLFLNDTPLMDVRAPVEFTKGAFPGSQNAPLMTDEERHQVGLCYKERGQAAAIELGHRLVRDEIKATRVARWRAFTEQNPHGYLYCFRGGLRSQIVQGWLREAGVDYPLVKGGYKALRRFLIDAFEPAVAQASFQVIGGRTGSGKSVVIRALSHAVDLEGLARHRGSSFGRLLEAQPTQIEFENALSIALLKALHFSEGPVRVEDESKLVGRCAVPPSLRERMQASPMIMVEESFDSRIALILQEYVVEMTEAFQARDGEEAGFAAFSAFLLGSLDRLQRRLGGARHQELRTLMQDALDAQRTRNELGLHEGWIAALLRDYYDPMYDYQLSLKPAKIAFRGNRAEVLDWLGAPPLATP